MAEIPVERPSDEYLRTKLRVGTDRCFCTVCARLFSTISSYEYHRKGSIDRRFCDVSKMTKGADDFWRRNNPTGRFKR